LELAPAPASETISIDVAPDGRTFAVSRGGRLALWDCRQHREIRTIRDDATWTFSCVEFSSDGSLLAATANSATERCVFLWELPSWKESKLELAISNLTLSSLVFSPESEFLAAGGDVKGGDSVISTWRRRKGRYQFVQTSAIPNEYLLTSLQFLPEGRIAAIAGFNGIRLFDLQTRQFRLLPRVTSASVTAMALTPDDTVIAAGGVGFVKLIDPATGDVAASIQIPTWAHSMEFLQDGETLAVGGGNGHVYFLRAHQ
jgi:WD40 repeat protein